MKIILSNIDYLLFYFINKKKKFPHIYNLIRNVSNKNYYFS